MTIAVRNCLGGCATGGVRRVLGEIIWIKGVARDLDLCVIGLWRGTVTDCQVELHLRGGCVEIEVERARVRPSGETLTWCALHGERLVCTECRGGASRHCMAQRVCASGRVIIVDAFVEAVGSTVGVGCRHDERECVGIATAAEICDRNAVVERSSGECHDSGVGAECEIVDARWGDWERILNRDRSGGCVERRVHIQVPGRKRNVVDDR